MKASLTEKLLSTPENEQSLLAAIIKSSQDAIISKTLDGIVTSWNAAAEKIFGFTQSEMLGNNISCLIPIPLRKEEDAIIDKIKTGETIDHLETERLRKDGRSIYVWLTISPIKDASGNIIGASKIVRDVTSQKKHEEEFATANKERELALNRISDGVVAVDNNWRYTFLNDAALGTHPLGRKETIGKVIWDVHPEMKGTVFWDKYHEAMKTKQVVEVESYYPPMESWFSVKAYPSDDGLTLFYQNITSSKKAEQQLKQTLKEIADYKYALDESSIVAITDQKGIITYVNNNFCKISKYPREELIGQDHRIINSKFHSKEFIRDLWVTIANGKIWTHEMRNMAKDGTIYWVDTTIVPFLNEQGKPYQYVAIRADITERKLTEEKLTKSEKIYKAIASSIPGSVICLFDRDYKYLLIEGDMVEPLGYKKEQLLGKKVSQVLSSEAFTEVEEALAKTLMGDTPILEARRGGYDIVTRYIPLKDEYQKVYAIVTVSIDITALKNAQRDISQLNRDLEEKIIHRTEELKKSNEELESFSYSISHDLRAPLRIIDGFGEILLEDYTEKLDEDGKQIINVIVNNARKMGVLIDDLLRFSKLGRTALSPSLVNMNDLVSEVLHELQIGGTEIPDQLHIEELKPAFGDSNLLKQVWINLISNAVKYSGRRTEPAIEIGMKYCDGVPAYYVKDNGVGFDMQYADKLFGVFQRLHREDEFSGVGVGLALVQRIVLRHGGAIWAEAKENEGATFFFTLPAHSQHLQKP